jgi:hypothetical protein
MFVLTLLLNGGLNQIMLDRKEEDRKTLFTHANPVNRS